MIRVGGLDRLWDRHKEPAKRHDPWQGTPANGWEGHRDGAGLYPAGVIQPWDESSLQAVEYLIQATQAILLAGFAEHIRIDLRIPAEQLLNVGLRLPSSGI